MSLLRQLAPAPELVWTAVAVLVTLTIIGLIWRAVSRRRSVALRDHFGPEYAHTVRATGSRARAERELLQRKEEVQQYDIRPLTAAERERYSGEWKRLEERFVQRPTTAVVEADELVADIMRVRGYPMGDWERHAAHLSVTHPRIVEHYRAGHQAIDDAAKASTEDLRQAMLHYRALYEELVNAGDDVVTDVPRAFETESEVRRREVLRDEDRPRV